MVGGDASADPRAMPSRTDNPNPTPQREGTSASDLTSVVPLLLAGVNGATAQLRLCLTMLGSGEAGVPIAASTVQAAILALEGVTSAGKQALTHQSGRESGQPGSSDPAAPHGRKRPRY